MSKKEFYEKYIQDNRTEDEKIMQKIHENAKKGLDNELHHKCCNQRNRGIYESHRGIFVTQLIIILLLALILVKLWI